MVYSPGTVIISSVAEVTDIRKVVEPVIQQEADTELLHIDFSLDEHHLGGSALSQVLNAIGQDTPDVKDAEYFARCFEAIQSLIEEGKILAGHDISSGGLLTTLLEMNFGNSTGGLQVDLSEIVSKDFHHLLFSENPGVVIQVRKSDNISDWLEDQNVGNLKIGEPIKERKLNLRWKTDKLSLDIDELRDLWMSTSYYLDKHQSGEKHADQRYLNYKTQILKYKFPEGFSGSLSELKLVNGSRAKSGTKAAIIREKGVNGDREMAYALYLAGFDVKDVHMTDLISGRETLEDVQMIVFVGGFSNSDVLGSAKGWAGAFLYNEKAKAALDQFYARPDTLSLGVCNGCQLMMELGLLYPEMGQHPKMQHNESHKFESGFVNMEIPQNNAVMLAGLAGTRLGIWIAHGEGKFELPGDEDQYHIAGTYGYQAYPANPNGSDFNVAALASKDGRHLAMMPHLERAIFPWNWAHYPADKKQQEVSPWILAFQAAKNWIESK